MTARSLPVRRRSFLFGIGGVLAACAAVVALCDWLVLPAEHTTPLPAPAEEESQEVTGGQAACPPSGAPAPGDVTSVVTSSALIECPDVYDGQVVRYEGEVIEVVLRRGDRAWVQLNDDPYGLLLGPLADHRTAVGGNAGLPVSIPGDVADRIRHVGSFRASGDVVSVTGRFRSADPADGGGPAIRATTAHVTTPGRVVEHQVSPRRLVVMVVLAVVALTLVVITVASRRRALR